MAGHYRKRNSPRQRGNMLGQLLLVLVVFVAGYLSASLYDLANVRAWVGSHVLANNSTVIITKSGVQQAQLPKPKFEFYTLLANEQVAGAASSPTAVLPVKPLPLHASQEPAAVAIQSSKAAALPLHAPLASVAAVAVTNPAPVVLAEKIPALIANSKESYMVQVGSFKNMQEAERMKASLVMKGFNVKIATSTQQYASWYRVIIGPFASRTQAQQAQLAFAKREHIMGMIRKMDA